MGAPNVCRSFAYFTDTSRQACASPTASAEIAIRPSSSTARNWRKPSPRLPSRLAAGTRQPSKLSPCVSEMCQPSLSYGASTVKPGVPAGTMIVEISPSPVRAVTVTRDVMSVPEFVMNDFAPSMTHSSPSSTARVFVAPASEPASGSVRPNAASFATGDEVGQPLLLLLVRAVGEDRIDAEPDAGLERDADRLVDPAEFLDGHAQRREVRAPAPPYSSGTTRPNRPSSPIARTTSTGKWWSRSHCATCGAISRSAKSRTTLRKVSWSWDSSKFIAASP